MDIRSPIAAKWPGRAGVEPVKSCAQPDSRVTFEDSEQGGACSARVVRDFAVRYFVSDGTFGVFTVPITSCLASITAYIWMVIAFTRFAPPLLGDDFAAQRGKLHVPHPFKIPVSLLDLPGRSCRGRHPSNRIDPRTLGRSEKRVRVPAIGWVTPGTRHNRQDRWNQHYLRLPGLLGLLA